MTTPQHLSTEQISDLLAGAVPATEAMGLNAHLASCVACQQVRDDLLEVIALLAEEGAAPVRMPDDVAAALDAALSRASSERTDGVTEIAAARRSAGRQPWKWLAGAAATVAVVSLGVAGLRTLPGHDPNSNAASDSTGGLRAPVNQPAAPEGSAYPPSDDFVGGSNELEAGLSVNAGQVPAAARRLASTSLHGPPSSYSAGGTACARPLTGDRWMNIRFQGQRAILSIDRATRLATIYDCATATETLDGPVGY